MYGERIARALQEDGQLTPAQVGEARRTQGFFGGDLSTHLLRLGLVDEEAVGRALSRITGVRYVWGRDLRAPSPDVLAALPREIASRHRACPVSRDGARILVAFLNPRDTGAVRAVGTAVGCEVEVCVTSEYQIEIALERHYGIRPDRRRGLRVPSGADASHPTPSHAAVEADVPPGSRSEPDGEPEIGLDGLPLDADPDLEHALFFGAEERSSTATRSPAPPEPPRVEPAAPGPIDAVAELSRRLADARDRDEITASILEFGATAASRVALFSVQREALRCVAARGRGIEGESVLRAEFPVGAGSVLDSGLAGGGFFFGTVPPTPPNRDLFTVFGGRLPRMAMVLPIAVKGRNAALFYLDNDEEDWNAADVPRMRRAAGKVGIALEILLLRKKLSES